MKRLSVKKIIAVMILIVIMSGCTATAERGGNSNSDQKPKAEANEAKGSPPTLFDLLIVFLICCG